MRRTLLVITILSVAFLLPACNSDDGDGGTGGEGDALHGVLFTADNAEYLAGTVTGALELFSGLNGAYIALLGAIEDYEFGTGETMPAEGYDLGALGICDSGQESARWKDLDDSKTLSAGDTVSLEVADCDAGISGTLDLSFSQVAFALTKATIEFDLVTDEMVDGSPETATMTARYQLEVNRIDQPNAGIIITHYVDDQTDGGSGLTATLNGEPNYDMGCFRLYYSINLDTGGFVLSEPYAVFDLPDYGVMSMISWGLEAFEFAGGDAPQSGETGLTAMSGSTPCSWLDIPGDGVDSNDSFLTVTVGDQGAVTLSGETDAGGAILIETTWDELN